MNSAAFARGQGRRNAAAAAPPVPHAFLMFAGSVPTLRTQSSISYSELDTAQVDQLAECNETSLERQVEELHEKQEELKTSFDFHVDSQRDVNGRLEQAMRYQDALVQRLEKARSMVASLNDEKGGHEQACVKIHKQSTANVSTYKSLMYLLVDSDKKPYAVWEKEQIQEHMELTNEEEVAGKLVSLSKCYGALNKMFNLGLEEHKDFPADEIIRTRKKVNGRRERENLKDLQKRIMFYMWIPYDDSDGAGDSRQPVPSFDTDAFAELDALEEEMLSPAKKPRLA